MNRNYFSVYEVKFGNIRYGSIRKCWVVLNGLIVSAGCRTNEALCQLSYETPYLGPEGSKIGRPAQAYMLRKFRNS